MSIATILPPLQPIIQGKVKMKKLSLERRAVFGLSAAPGSHLSGGVTKSFDVLPGDVGKEVLCPVAPGPLTPHARADLPSCLSYFFNFYPTLYDWLQRGMDFSNQLGISYTNRLDSEISKNCTLNFVAFILFPQSERSVFFWTRQNTREKAIINRYFTCILWYIKGRRWDIELLEPRIEGLRWSSYDEFDGSIRKSLYIDFQKIVFEIVSPFLR